MALAVTMGAVGVSAMATRLDPPVTLPGLQTLAASAVVMVLFGGALRATPLPRLAAMLSVAALDAGCVMLNIYALGRIPLPTQLV